MLKAKPAHLALALLLAINLLNYVDRQILSSVLPLIQSDLRLSDAQSGLLASIFILVYMAAALPIAYLAERGSRIYWIAGSIAFWSLATAFSGAATGFRGLLAARAAVGIGESGYGALAPALIAEHYPDGSRARALAYLSASIPVGYALGYIAGGLLGQTWGWRAAFWIVGLPGLALALLSLKIVDPRSASEVSAKHPKEFAWREALRCYAELLCIPSFALVALAGAGMTYALGGLSYWMPTYIHRNWGVDVSSANLNLGLITVASGIAGSLAGGRLAELALRHTCSPYFLVSGAGFLIGAPLAALALTAVQTKAAYVLLFLAEFFLFLNMGPLNAVIANVTGSAVKTMAFAANLFIVHALGDAISPAIIGLLSDRFGLKFALLHSLGGLWLGGLFCLLGMRYYEADRIKAA